MLRISEINLPLSFTKKELQKQAAKRLKIPEAAIESVALVRKSVDARRKDAVKFICTADVCVENESKLFAKLKDNKIQKVSPYKYILPTSKMLPQRPVIAGFGPAGIFAALILARAGQKPIVLERGACVEERQKQTENFWNNGILNTETNVQFGEGGAGTFSDGKLNTGTKDPRSHFVLEEFVKAGAPDCILTDAKPHIGTDRLPQTVCSIRKEIIRLGGEVRFNTKLTGVILKNGKLAAVRAKSQNGTEFILETCHLILAVGHSARDTFYSLYSQGIHMQAKPFSVGARIEHLQSEINRAQYGDFAEHPALGAADYKLAVHLPSGRGVYTFCMCPGGEVVAAASEECGVVTNGMSRFARNGINANSALLVGVTPKDFGEEPLAGIEFQRSIENAAFKAAGETYAAPAQTVGDFLADNKSHSFGTVNPSYLPGVVPTTLETCLPRFVTESMRQGICFMGKRLSGFNSSQAVLTAPETRSSSPVRILRDDTCTADSLKGLYPCGEGAGYAGGIISAATDGIRCAEAVLKDSFLY